MACVTLLAEAGRNWWTLLIRALALVWLIGLQVLIAGILPVVGDNT